MENKEYTVWFQVMGRYTDSNNIGRGFVEATSKEEALKFAKEDLRRGMFTDIEIDCDGTLDDADETDDDGNTSHSWNVNWGGTGEHGRYYATGGPYAKNEDDAIALQMQDLTEPDWFNGWEDELTVDDE